jgi:hypothetical protein
LDTMYKIHGYSHRHELLDDKWNCDRWGVVLTPSQLERLCDRLCHARRIVHLPWIPVSVENRESRANSRGSLQPQKGICDIQVIMFHVKTLIADLVYSSQIPVYSKTWLFA